MHQLEPVRLGLNVDTSARQAMQFAAAAGIQGKWKVRCRGKDGQIKWEDEITNLVVNEGLNALLSATLAAGSQITSWFLGLIDASPTIAGADTLASQAGWSEVDDYDGNRQAWTPGSVTGQSVDNGAAAAEFEIDDTVTVGGAFLCSAATGTSGVLYAAGAFQGGNRALQASDTLEVTATFTTSAA